MVTYCIILLDRSFDYLEIANENSVAVGKYCGWHTGKIIYIGGNEAILTFHSDSSYEARGFYLFFASTQPCKCNESLLKTILLDRAWSIPVKYNCWHSLLQCRFVFYWKPIFCQNCLTGLLHAICYLFKNLKHFSHKLNYKINGPFLWVRLQFRNWNWRP